MANIDDSEEKRAKEILLKNYNILEYGRIDKANPTNLSLRIHRDLDFRTSNGYFYYKTNENTLEIDFWAENFEEGTKSISTWWAVSKAELDPNDKYNQNKRKLYLRAYIPLFISMIAIYWVMFGSLHWIYPLMGIIISSFFFWPIIKEISDWKKRLKIKVKENLRKIDYNLSESDLNATIKNDCSSMIDKKMAPIMGIILLIFAFLFLMSAIFDFFKIG